MANEVTYTGHGNFFLAAALNDRIHETIVDKTDLSVTCTYMGSINGSGSVASKIPTVSYDDAMAAANTNETTTIGNTDIGNGAVTVTVGRQALQYIVTDIYEIARAGAPGIEAFADKMVLGAQLRFTDMLCALFTSLSSSVGTSGADLTVDDIYDGLYTLIRARASGRRHIVLAPIQLTDFLDSLRGEGMKLTPPDAGSTLASIGDTQGWGFHGTFAGAAVWSTDSAATNGGDREGAIYTDACFGYKDGVPEAALMHAAPGSYMSLAPNGARVFVEFERDSGKAWSLVTGNYFVGVAEIEDAQGVKVVTSAT